MKYLNHTNIPDSLKELLSNIKDFDLELPANIWSELEDAGLIERL